MRQHFLKLHSAFVGYTLAPDPSSAPTLILAPQHGDIFEALWHQAVSSLLWPLLP